MIPKELIESALQLTGKTMDLVLETKTIDHGSYGHEPYEVISIEKFSYYLLDRNFLIKYYQNQKPGYTPSIETTDLMAGEFGYAIMEYQSGNEEHLIKLLTPICKTTNND